MKFLLQLLWSIAGCLVLQTGFAADTAESPWVVSFSGSHRTRFQTLGNQFRPGLNGGDQGLNLRTLVKGQADRGPLSLVAELQDSRNYLNDQGSYLSTYDINALEPLQLYAAYLMRDVLRSGDSLTLKGGLFTMGFGNQRLVGRHGFRNTIQNFAGVMADWQPAPQKSLSAFWVLPVKIRPADRQGLLDNHVHRDKADDSLQLLGVYYKTPLARDGLVLESYLFSLQEADDGSNPRTADRQLYTPGFRLLKAPAANSWDYEFELAYQWGSRRASTGPGDTRTLDVSAGFVHGTIGRRFDVPWQPRLALLWTRASGDRAPGDEDFERFDGLFGPRREYGPTSIFGMLGRSNMQSTGLQLTLAPASGTDFMVTLRRNRLVSATDSFASSGIRDVSGLAGKNAGTQFDFRLRHWLRQDALRLEIGGAVNHNGAFFERAPNATGAGDPGYLYTDLTFYF